MREELYRFDLRWIGGRLGAVVLTTLVTVGVVGVNADVPGVAPELDAIGAGELLAVSDGAYVPLPTLDVRVEVEVAGILLSGRITQRFRNPGTETIEALYAFPLPARAAVHHMEMHVGDRRIRAEIREREQAQRTYEQARATGRRAAVVHQHRPNLFTATVANINPGDTVDVVLEYTEELPAVDGAFSFRFPMTFLPRFDDAGGSDDTDVAPAVPDVSIEVSLHAGVPIERVTSSSHEIRTEDCGDALFVDTAAARVPGDRDFVLGWRPRPAVGPSVAFLTEQRDDVRYALAVVYPPSSGTDAEGIPTDTVFVVDVSGSMSGPSLRHARAALDIAIERLRPEDRFDLVAFSDVTRTFAGEPQFAEPETVERAGAWLDGLQAHGGTRILPALEEGLRCLAESPSSTRQQRIVFLTDGAIAREDLVFRRIVEQLGDVRLHTIGIGHAPNTYLMRKMARFGGGLAEFAADPAEAGERIRRFFERIERPVVTGLSLTWDGVEPDESLASSEIDLYAGEPLIVWARLGTGRLPRGLTVEGFGRSGSFDSFSALAAVEGPGIARRWARAKIDSLEDSVNEGADRNDVRREVTDLALAFGLVTRYTSLVAVEQRPTALGAPTPVRIGGVLPRGGTLESLWTVVAFALAATGVAFLFAARRLVR